MKKVLLTLGATSAAIAPIATIVACSENNPDNQGPGTTGPGTTGPGTIDPKHSVEHHKDISQSAFEKSLTNFKVSEITEDPWVQGFDMVSPHNPGAIFKVFDNGLFKVKIQTSLIGKDKFFSDESKAELEAKYIAESINFGPAITHLEKGIQIIDSTSGASLGGDLGVQIALGNTHKSVDDAALKNEASLIDHEYGHHETMWDFTNVVKGSTIKDFNNPKTMGVAMANILEQAGYQKIADIVRQYKDIKADLSFNQHPDAKAFPTAYGSIDTTNHSIFNSENYPFDPSEIATRVLNILSCRTDLSAADLYAPGKGGKYLDGSGYTFDLPAAFVSDATIRNFADDSIFGEGKDYSRAPRLIAGYMKEIFGLGKGSIRLNGNANSGQVTELHLSSFDAVPGLTKLEITDSNNLHIADIPVTSTESRFGFKNELVSDVWASKYTDDVQSASAKFNAVVSATDAYTITGRDKNGKELDLSSLELVNMSNIPNTMTWETSFLKHDGKYLTIIGS